MVNKLVVIIILSILSFPILAQEEYEPGLELGLYSGVSIPLGKFGNKELSDWDEHCGCANTRGSFTIKARGRIKNNFFGVFGFQRLWNAYDAKPIAKSLNEDFDAPFSVETDSWKSNIFQLGIGYDFLLNHDALSKWHLSIEMTGIMNTLETYSFQIRSPDGSNRYPLNQESVDDIGFGYSFGSGISVDWEMIGLRFTTDYITSSHSIKDANRRYNGGDLEAIRYNQKIELLVIQIGLIIRAY